MIAIVCRKLAALAAGEVEQEDVGVFAVSANLGIGNRLAVAGKYLAEVGQVRRRVLRNVLYVAGVNVDDIDFVARAVFGLGGVGNLLAVGRPNRRLLGDFLGRRQVYHVTGFGRDQEHVPHLA